MTKPVGLGLFLGGVFGAGGGGAEVEEILLLEGTPQVSGNDGIVLEGAGRPGDELLLLERAGAVGEDTPFTVLLITNSLEADAIVGFVIGTFLTAGGVGPYTYTLTDPDGLLSVDGSNLEVAGDFTGRTSYTFLVETEDSLLATHTQQITLLVVESNDPPIDDISDGDPVLSDGEFEVPPIIGDSSDGTRIGGKTSGRAVLLADVGPLTADVLVTMRYSADWSGLTRQGREAAVGFGFKENNDFHLVGLRGNGANPATILASRIYGSFDTPNGFTVTDDGAATHGTRLGSNWLQLQIAADGTTYTFRTSSNGSDWTDEITGVLPTPIGAVTDALQFGPGAVFTAQDRGAFIINIEYFSIQSLDFPIIAGTNTSQHSTATSSHQVALPAGIEAGDLLIIYVTLGGQFSPTVSVPSGWTQLVNAGSAFARSAIFYKIASGSEGAVVAVSGSNRQSTHMSMRITGYAGTPEAAAVLVTEASGFDPPEVSPSWGAAKTLWIAFIGIRNGSNVINADALIADGYVGLLSSRLLDNSLNTCRCLLLRKPEETATENPAAYVSGITGGVAATIAIQPAL